MINKIYQDLRNSFKLKKKDLILVNSKTRDKNIKVLLDPVSEAIFLEKITNNKLYYEKKKKNRIGSYSLNKYNNKIIKIKKIKYKNYKNIQSQNIFGDDYRRLEYFKKFFKKNHKICDFGCGFGGFLKILKKKINKTVYGIEINKKSKSNINDKNIIIEDNLDNFNFKFDRITSFHVLEHLPNQLEILRKFYLKLKKGGKLILEVPHSNDLLIKKLILKDYRDFIFWSEHLILHSEKSLSKYLKIVGFKNIKIFFYQRHNYLNHINWILNQDYAGHIKYKKYYSASVDGFYNKLITKKKLSDTIKVVAEK